MNLIFKFCAENQCDVFCLYHNEDDPTFGFCVNCIRGTLYQGIKDLSHFQFTLFNLKRKGEKKRHE